MLFIMLISYIMYRVVYLLVLLEIPEPSSLVYINRAELIAGQRKSAYSNVILELTNRSVNTSLFHCILDK